MAKALIFLAEGYEEVEMLTVVDMVRRAKIDIDMVAIGDQRVVKSSHGVCITADRLLDEADFAEAQMLILPGGIPGTPNLRACATPAIAAICKRRKMGCSGVCSTYCAW